MQYNDFAYYNLIKRKGTRCISEGTLLFRDMNIIVVGCGKIGTSIISALEAEGHDLTVMDLSEKAVSDIVNIYDVIGICGNGADCEVLQEAGADKCDIFIAVTGSDELNMLSCFFAKKLGAKHTVARIRNPEYNDRSLSFMRQQLDLSMSINPELLAAQELHNILKIPSAYKVEYFSRRNLEVIEVKLKKDSSLVGKKLSKLREKQNVNFLIGAVLRNGELIIPDGSFELAQGDTISIVAAPHEMQKLLKSFGVIQKTVRDVMILGGSKTAYYLAKILSSSNTNVKIVEKNIDVCRFLGERLPKAVVIHGDGADHELLLEEGLRSLDAFVALTGMDEENILISIFASDVNVSKVISKVNNTDLARTAGRLGLDCLVSPKDIISSVLVRYARALQNSRGSGIETLYKLMDGKAEALEFGVHPDSRLIGRPIKDLPLKSGILIAGIIRERKTAIIPTGDDTIHSGDRVIVLSPASYRLTDLSDIIKKV